MSIRKNVPRWGDRPLGLLVAGMLLAPISGCSDAAAERAAIAGAVPVSGTVLLDGQPLAGASVHFIPAPGGPVDQAPVGASAVTGADGKYSLACGPENPGALPGAYRVVVSKLVLPDGSSPAAEVGGLVPPEQLRLLGAQELVSWEHSDLLSSTLVAEVPPEGGEIVLEVLPAKK